MAFAETDDGIKLYFEETGRGEPVLFVHEFAGDHRSWEPQVRHFARRYRCITYDARGYPPSDVPEDPGRYSQARATADIKAVLDHLNIARAHTNAPAATSESSPSVTPGKITAPTPTRAPFFMITPLKCLNRSLVRPT